MIILVIISRVIKTFTSDFSFSVSDKWPNPLQMTCTAANGAASVQRAEDPMGLLVDMFDLKDEIHEEIDAMT